MSVTRGLVLSALCGVMLGGLPVAANAQVYDAARQSLDFSPDPTARSPRLLGMGQLSLASDVHNHIDLWDFAENPLGIAAAETSSTFDLRPATSSASAQHVPLGGTRERQSLAGRELRLGYEAFRRSPTGTAYGFYGDVAQLRADRPYDETTALRGRLESPRIVGVLNGRMPRFETQRMQYDLYAFYRSESDVDEYRTFLSNAQGDYLGRRGDLLPAPSLFDPNKLTVSTLGGGAGVSYRLGPWMTAAVGGEALSSRIEGDNSSPIHSTGTGEDRPYYTGRVDLVGRLGAGLEYGFDWKTWTSTSEERYVFTLKAGRNQDPFTGRGKVLDREETGTEARGRLRWTRGSLETNGSWRAWSSTVDITPPPPTDASSFNYLLDTAANRDGADSLALPDSVRRSTADDSGWEIAYGATWKLARGKGLIGFESHLTKTEATDQVFRVHAATPFDTVTFYGQGPDRKVWDVRGGIEYLCAPALKGRLGYIYRWDDHDERTNLSEYKSHTLTAGLGLSPVGATWSLDLGWAIEWIAPDFEDASTPKEGRQQMAAQVRWVF